jgi:hypothetical protein
LVSDPDGEFAAAAFDQLDVDSESLFDGGRRTGGTWPVGRSDLAETNSYFTHGWIIQLARSFCCGSELMINRILF